MYSTTYEFYEESKITKVLQNFEHTCRCVKELQKGSLHCILISSKKLNVQLYLVRVAVEWKPEGHRKRGRPKMTWRRTVEAEAKAMGHSWGTLRTLAQDRLRWREFVAALVVYDKKGSK